MISELRKHVVKLVKKKSFWDLTKDLSDPYQWYFYNTDMQYGIVQCWRAGAGKNP